MAVVWNDNKIVAYLWIDQVCGSVLGFGMIRFDRSQIVSKID
jgi:hypothetical protein